MPRKSLSILCFGAHPDDCDLQFGGTAMLYRALGHRVKFVSLTNGDTGHQAMGGGALAQRRYREAQASAKVAGIEYDVLDIHTGELEPTVPVRKQVIRLIREWEADLVLCHRPNDYHPDHRATGVLVQDASYIVTVPQMAALTPHLRRAPVVGYLFDRFTQPAPYVAHIAIDIGEVFERKVDMVHCHESQMYEWLPYNGGTLDEVPTGNRQRKTWMRKRLQQRCAGVADTVRETLVKLYGKKRGAAVKYAETVSIAEYGRALPEKEYRALFPFLPTKRASRRS